jgi:hypothetical protein
MAKPRLLIGSSAAERPNALSLQAGIEDLAQVTRYCRAEFDPPGRFLDGIFEALHEFDFAAFLIGEDDLAAKRKRAEPGDSILLPLGMFLGALGRQRTFVVCAAETARELPAELRGVVTATYPPPRSHGAAPSLACACAILKEQITRLVPAVMTAKPTSPVEKPDPEVARRRRKSALGTAYLVGPRRVLRIADISMSGALLETYGEIPEGQLLELDLALENGSRVRVSARVARNQHPQWGRVGGVGVAFLRFEGDSREHLSRYIKDDPELLEESAVEIGDRPAR